MVESTFKGIKIQDHMWVQGDYIRAEGGKSYIGTLDFAYDDSGILILNPLILHEVYPHTVSKNSQVQDIYGRYIHENDTIRLTEDAAVRQWVSQPLGTILYKDGTFLSNHGQEMYYLAEFIDKDGIFQGEVTGTIFETPSWDLSLDSE